MHNVIFQTPTIMRGIGAVTKSKNEDRWLLRHRGFAKLIHNVLNNLGSVHQLIHILIHQLTSVGIGDVN